MSWIYEHIIPFLGTFFLSWVFQVYSNIYDYMHNIYNVLNFGDIFAYLDTNGVENKWVDGVNSEMKDGKLMRLNAWDQLWKLSRANSSRQNSKVCMGLNQCDLNVSYICPGFWCVFVRALLMKPWVTLVNIIPQKLRKWGHNWLHNSGVGGSTTIFINNIALYKLKLLSFKGKQEVLKLLHEFYGTTHNRGLVTLHTKTIRKKNKTKQNKLSN